MGGLVGNDFSDLWVHSDRVKQIPFYPTTQYLGVVSTQHIFPRVIWTMSLKEIILWHHWGSETETHVCLPIASSWSSCSAGKPRVLGTCGQDEATTFLPAVSPVAVLLILVLSIAATPRILPSLSASRDQ